MPKPAMPVFGASAMVPSSKLNQSAELAEYGANPPAVIVDRVATQSLTSGVAALVQFDTAVYDPDGLLATATTVLPPAGLWLAVGQIHIAASATGIRVLEVVQNALIVATDARNAPSVADHRANVVGGLLTLAGDGVGLQAFQNSGGPLNITYARLALFRQAGA